ncbi:hypothetical protein [Prosthecobacter dejongeii]|uniref:Uncharacterized protein n=1 Tax=Prosthecobacter dejongeii TaxID=48465 RepID=A0A7W8DQB5_9BACT|nr:hypothetical protein [Prosthecobacter dejongeii]MBB5038283.1 hypothetical protein [Prosthecobacter dejongeii]
MLVFLMRLILLAVFSVLISSTNAEEFVTLMAPATPVNSFSESVILKAGDCSRILYTGYDTEGVTSSGVTVEVTIGQSVFGYPLSGATATLVIAGPATLRLKKNSPFSPAAGLVTLGITRALTAENAVPSNAVVIPNDATGQFQVILESSTDMITWTAALPGTYGGSTEKRFFRTRIQRTP